MGFVDHDFGGGLTVKNSTYFADYKKFYQNVYPGNGPLSGAVDPSQYHLQPRRLQPSDQPRQIFNHTDFVFKGYTGPIFHTIGLWNAVRPADGHRSPQHRTCFRTAPTRSSAIRGPDLFRAGRFHPPVPGGVLARRQHGRFQQQIPLNTGSVLCARHDRDHAAACR